MSHHFDTPTAQQDPRINVCDLYLFRGAPGTAVMAMMVNPSAGLSAPDTFRDEALYAFRFDLDGDAHEEVTFKFRFSAVRHADADGLKHVQSFEVRRATDKSAREGADGELIFSGQTDSMASAQTGVRAFAGLAPDLFAGDGAALGKFRNALFREGRFDPAAFQSRKNLFASRNVSAIVLEVPSALIGRDRVHGWATASLYGHAPEVQVSRWGLPLITNFFMPDPAMKEDFNRTVPSEDLVRFAPQIAKVAELLTALAGSALSPSVYAKRLVARLCPVTLAYELDTPASFSFADFNGRALTDDVMDVILTLAANTPIADGVAPDKNRVRDEFPYYGPPYTRAEQLDVDRTQALEQN